MIGEIIAIGDELTSGRIANTTSRYAAQRLYAEGYTVRAVHTIGDSFELIGKTIQKSLQHSDFLLITGGLGPTTDDITNEAVIRALGLEKELNRQVLASLEKRLAPLDGRKRAVIDKMALLPQNAAILDESYKMAGYILKHEDKPLFFLPGVPTQMELLLATKVLPALREKTLVSAGQVSQKVYRCFGLPESVINERLLELEKQPGVQIGYYPVNCEVHISVTIRSSTLSTQNDLVQDTDTFLTQALGANIYGTDKTSMAETVGNLILKQKGMLCIAESCTGGLICSKITEVAGSSLWFAGGIVAYSNDAKETMLNVDRALLTHYGAVSAEAARAMAARLAQKLNCPTAVSVTGIAGPGGGTEQKPVGTVYIGLYHNNKVSEQLHHFTGTRNQIQEQTALTALDTVRRACL